MPTANTEDHDGDEVGNVGLADTVSDLPARKFAAACYFADVWGLRVAVGLAMAAAAGCFVSVDFQGVEFRCAEGENVCPDDMVCGEDFICRFPADAGTTPDAAPSGLINGPGTWVATSASPLEPRVWVDALWSGSEFLVFGGAFDTMFTSTDTGARYNPDTQEWSEMNLIGAPSARHTTMQVWTGTEALNYGGAVGFGATDGGARYNPATDSWAPMSTVGAPGQRIYGASVWTGQQMLVWGGWSAATGHYNTGFLYDPDDDEWTAMSTVNAPVAGSFASVVWTGDSAIVFGGCSGPMGACPDNSDTSGRYHVGTDTWLPISTDGAPGPRSQHSAVWTGTEMIIFGGATEANSGGTVSTGFAYNLSTDSWRPLSSIDAPSPRADHAALWVGDKMLVWGSADGNNLGYLYDPVADTWELMSPANRPSGRSRFANAVTEDGRMFIWGGLFDDTNGGVWSPEGLE